LADGQGPRLRLAGRWRIDFLDLVEKAHITFRGGANGEIAFGALNGDLDVRYGSREGSACAEFSWQGNDEGDSVCGRCCGAPQNWRGKLSAN
jgi:hypothetical protein